MRGQKMAELDRKYQKTQLQVKRFKSSPISSLKAYLFPRYRLYSENLILAHARPEVDRTRSKIWKGQLTGLELSFETNVESLDQSVLKLWTWQKITDGQTDTLNDWPTDRRTPPIFRPPTDRWGLKTLRFEQLNITMNIYSEYVWIFENIAQTS